MIIGTKHQINTAENLYEPIVNGEELKWVRITKKLGLLIGNELRFSDHINNLVQNAFYRLKILYGIREFLSEDVRKLLSDLLVLSSLNYCDVVYGPRILQKTKKCIQKVQNACIRFCYRVPGRSHKSPIINAKGLLNMESRRHVHLLVFIHRVITDKRASYLYNKLFWCADDHNFNTRSKLKNKLIIPKHRTQGYRGSFKYTASKIWNNIPPPLRNIKNAFNFKNEFKHVNGNG